jgi:hypothetical protein
MVCRLPSSFVLVLMLLAVALGGCVVDPSAMTELPGPSRANFAVEAGPILAKRCGDYACHGNADRPYALYAVSRRRLAPADQFTSHPLTTLEWDANYRATLGFLDAPRGRDTTLIQKALAVGGVGGHKGGALFAAPSDPECQAILSWIAGSAP